MLGVTSSAAGLGALRGLCLAAITPRLDWSYHPTLMTTVHPSEWLGSYSYLFIFWKLGNIFLCPCGCAWSTAKR